MNSKVLFNKNFFLENLKKSKGLLAFLFGVVPLLNILFLIICLLEKNTLMTFSSLSTITHIGMYIIPPTLAISLLGFVFKQKSVDFVMSKPISRKSIYFTNIIGGVIVLILFMLINTLIFGIFGLMFENLIIPFSLLVDYFIFYLISYVFMYTASSLAVTIAGNFITSIVLLLIIISLYPFLSLAIGGLTNSYDSSYLNCQEEACKPTKYECFSSTDCQEELAKNNYIYYMDKKIGEDFTTPVRFFSNFENMYSTRVVIKMFILSVIYIFLGYISFKRRKMEDNEIDFKDEFKHYLVKSITFLPVCIITYLLMSELDLVGLLVGFALAFIYYIVYDLITRKEIYRFAKSFGVFLVTFGIFNGSYALINQIQVKNVVYLKDIKSLIIEVNDYTYEITNRDIINKIFSGALSSTDKNNYYYDVTVNTKKGNYLTNFYLNDEENKEVENYINNQRKDIILNYNYNKIDAITYNNINIPVTKELQKILNDDIKNYKGLSASYITVKKYQNHNYDYLLIPVNLSEDLYKYIINYTNDFVVNAIKKDRYAFDFHLNDNDLTDFTELDNYVATYVLENNLDLFIEYLENDNKITYTDKYIDIDCYSYRDHYSIRITDIENFKKEFKKYKARVEENIEYQNLYKEFKESILEVSDEY